MPITATCTGPANHPSSFDPQLGDSVAPQQETHNKANTKYHRLFSRFKTCIKEVTDKLTACCRRESSSSEARVQNNDLELVNTAFWNGGFGVGRGMMR